MSLSVTDDYQEGYNFNIKISMIFTSNITKTIDEDNILLFSVIDKVLYCSEVGSNADSQSRGREIESQLDQHSFRRLTKVTVTSVIRFSPMG